MIQIEKEVNGLIETIEIAENWDEVYYVSYVKLIKNKILSIENNYERTIKTLACVSTNEQKCEEWLKEMSIAQFEDLVKMFEFISFEEIELKEKDFLEVEGRRFKIRKDFNEIKWGNQITFERLKEQFKDTEDFVLALGALLIEVDESGKEMDFDIKTFDFCVNVVPEKVLMVDLFTHVNFFLTGGERQSLKTLPKFIIKKVK